MNLFSAWTLLAACSLGSPAGLEVLHFSLEDLPSPSEEERSQLVEAPPVRVTQRCRDAQLSFEFVPLTHPQTGAAYFDKLRVTVVDAEGYDIDAGAGNVENRGDASRVEMALPVIVGAGTSALLTSSLVECSYLVRARPPYVEPR